MHKEQPPFILSSPRPSPFSALSSSNPWPESLILKHIWPESPANSTQIREVPLCFKEFVIASSVTRNRHGDTPSGTRSGERPYYRQHQACLVSSIISAFCPSLTQEWPTTCSYSGVNAIRCTFPVRILSVDDNPAILETAAKLLAPRFDVVGAVGDGQSAVEAFAKLSPDLVVMDVSMPVLNGIEATRILRKASPDVKIVFLTVDGSVDLQQAALEAGGLGYVLKKRLGSDLPKAIDLALTGRQFICPS